MPSFEAGDIVRVPFPYTDRPVRQWRPALVVSNGVIADAPALLWVVMITSAENRAWPSDIPLVEDYRAIGLPAPSLIRPAKIATLEAADAEAIGRLPDHLLSAVRQAIQKVLGLQALP